MTTGPATPRVAAACLGALVALATLAACSDDTPAPAPGRQAATPPAAVAEAPRPACPPRVASAVSGPDVIGLHLGLTRDEAMALVQCAWPDAVLTRKSSWVAQVKTHGQTLDAQAFDVQVGDSEPCNHAQLMKSGQYGRCGAGNRVWSHVAERVLVATPGVPGSERVQGIWRAQRFRDGEMPTQTLAVQALLDKYGADAQRHLQGQRLRLSWVRDADGHPVDLRRDGRCAGIQPSADAPQSWRGDCGLSIVAELLPPRDNPALVQELRVALVHQGRLMAASEALQNGLDARDAARRTQEVQQADGRKLKL